MPVEFRRSEPTDSITELTALLHTAYARLANMNLRFTATFQSERTTRYRCEEGECYVGFKEGKLVATIVFKDAKATEGCDWYDRPDVASFGQFAVHPSLQGQGVGTKLIEIAETRARETGAKEIALDTAEGATHLIEYYAKKGYRQVAFADWRDTNYISVVMSKAL